MMQVEVEDHMDPLAVMRNSLQTALDELASPRSTLQTQTEALADIERQIAACLKEDFGEDLELFLALQYTFECNVPSRLLPWITTSTAALELISNKDTKQTEASAMSAQLALSLFLLQGVALMHPPSKQFLGRKCSLEVLLDLLLASRHLSAIPSSYVPNLSESPSKTRVPVSQLPLSSVVLDTLICVLVDSPAALRAFEDCRGVQGVVKILKRAGTPREVRMKCLEFLYFYLMDEKQPTSPDVTQDVEPILTPTVPSTPAQAPARKPFIASAPRRPVSRYGSSTFDFGSVGSDILSPSTSSSRSTSGSSFSSTSSNASSSTAPSSTAPSTPGSPKKQSFSRLAPMAETAARPISPVKRSQPRSLLMLKKEVDFIPASPQRGPVGRFEPNKTHIRSPSNLSSFNQNDTQDEEMESQLNELRGSGINSDQTRTIAQKKEILGTMLGNVDALVESVTKAGIWGLG